MSAIQIIDTNAVLESGKYLFIGAPFNTIVGDYAEAAAWGLWVLFLLSYAVTMSKFSPQKIAWAGLWIWAVAVMLLWGFFGTTATLQIGLSALFLIFNAILSKRNLQKL